MRLRAREIRPAGAVFLFASLASRVKKRAAPNGFFPL